MQKTYKVFFLASCLSAIVACSDSSEGDSLMLLPEASSSSLSNGSSSSVLVTPPVPGDTSVFYDTVSVFIDDTTGKELHYLGHSTLRITEIAAQNISWLDHDAEDPGWVEIYNAGQDTADLRGY